MDVDDDDDDDSCLFEQVGPGVYSQMIRLR